MNWLFGKLIKGFCIERFVISSLITRKSRISCLFRLALMKFNTVFLYSLVIILICYFYCRKHEMVSRNKYVLKSWWEIYRKFRRTTHYWLRTRQKFHKTLIFYEGKAQNNEWIKGTGYDRIIRNKYEYKQYKLFHRITSVCTQLNHGRISNMAFSLFMIII